MNPTEWELLVTIGVAIALWVSGEFRETYFSLPATLLSAALVGVGAMAYLGLRGILQWEDGRELTCAPPLLLRASPFGVDMNEHAMTILVVGAGKTGTQVLRQLFTIADVPVIEVARSTARRGRWP